MSRSFKKVFGGKLCGDSDKISKTMANKKFRRTIKNLIKKGVETLPLKREVTDVWDFQSDGGSIYMGFLSPDVDPDAVRKYMRK